MINVLQNKMTKVKEDGTIVELVPPEGGWGYMICTSFIILFVASIGTQSCFGLIYNDFLEVIDQGTSIVTTTQCFSTVTVSISAMITAAALKRLSIRQVGLVGVSIGTLASALSIFVSSAYQMIAYAILQSTSHGITMTIMYTSFNSYFVEKRFYAMSICKSIAAAILMVYPLMIKYFLLEYGFRGTLAMICGIFANSFIAVLLMQSVEKHLVEKVVSPTNYKEYQEEDYDINKLKDPKYDTKLQKLLLPKSQRKASISKTIITLRENENFEKTELENHFIAASLTSINSFKSGYVAMRAEKESTFRVIAKFFDLDLLSDWVFVNICVGLSFCFFSDITFVTLMPFMLFNNNFTKDQVAICLSTIAAGDFAARIILVIISRWKKLKPRNVFYFGAIVSFLFRLVFNFITEFYLVVILVFLLGMSKSFIQLMTALTLADHVKMEQFPSAFALNTVLNGLISTTLAPVVGFIRDMTGSYNMAFGILTSAFLVCIIPWTIEFIMVNKRQKINDR